MAAETFDICSEFPFTRISWRPAASTPDGSPAVRVREINERELRIYKLVWSQAPRQLIARIRDLYRNRTFGPTVAMDFDPPDDPSIEVRFLEGSLRYSITGATTVDCELELEEVR
jgi:hypothetical protein